jgi:hypothetical protein
MKLDHELQTDQDKIKPEISVGISFGKDSPNLNICNLLALSFPQRIVPLTGA